VKRDYPKAHSLALRMLAAPLLLALLLHEGAAVAVEEPAFILTFEERAFKVRNYPPLVAAEVSVSGDRNAASSAAFINHFAKPHGDKFQAR
jgi:hypothetical protein